MTKEKSLKKLRKIIIDSFEGGCGRDPFKYDTFEFYLGYVTATIKLQNLNLNVTKEEVATEAEKLIEEGII